MKKLSLLAFSAFLIITNSNSYAQSSNRTSVVMHKVTQIGHIQSGASKFFILKGSRLNKGVASDTFKLSGLNNNEITRDCLELASKQNLNALQQPSSLIVAFGYETASGGGVIGQPINHEFQKVVITSCSLNN